MDEESKKLIKELFGESFGDIIKQYERKIAELEERSQKSFYDEDEQHEEPSNPPSTPSFCGSFIEILFFASIWSR